MRLRDGSVQHESELFDAALTQAVEAPADERDRRLTSWTELPHARLANPREEHLILLMVAAGAGAEDRGRHVFGDRVIGWTVSGYRFG